MPMPSHAAGPEVTSGATRVAPGSGSAGTHSRAVSGFAQLLRFGWVQVQCCLFAVAVFVGLAVSSVVPLPIPRYDALLAYALVLTAVFFVLRLETGREVAVIFAFHLIGLALEVFKVRVGSWSYPEAAWTKVGGVPLYSGFMYAAVGSYICQAFRRFDLRVNRFPWVPAVALAVGGVRELLHPPLPAGPALGWSPPASSSCCGAAGSPSPWVSAGTPCRSACPSC